MSWDIVCTVILYLTQAVLALLGIYVSLKPPPKEQYSIFIAVFIFVALIGISAGIGLQLDSKREKENQQREHKGEMVKINDELLQSQLSRERLQGKFDAVVLLIGKSGDRMASAVLKLAESSSQVTAATNKQICTNTMDIVKRMHSFARNRKNKSNHLINKEMNESRNANTEQERKQLWQQHTAQLTQLWNDEQYEFRSTILGEALYLKDELLKRLPSEPKPGNRYPFHVFEGSLAGNYPEEEVADYLEGLSRKLCP
jgi:hypothetical protein